jgi:hypothetical protein
VRIRTLLAMSTGAAFGAGWMYLMDPEHGKQRRREARRGAVRQARDGAVRTALDAKGRVEEVALAAVRGYHEASTAAARPGQLHQLDEHRAS